MVEFVYLYKFIKSYVMRTVDKNASTPSKGDRLKWTPLREAKQVPITKKLTKGRNVPSKELSKNKSKLLVP